MLWFRRHPFRLRVVRGMERDATRRAAMQCAALDNNYDDATRYDVIRRAKDERDLDRGQPTIEGIRQLTSRAKAFAHNCKGRDASFIRGKRAPSHGCLRL